MYPLKLCKNNVLQINTELGVWLSSGADPRSQLTAVRCSAEAQMSLTHQTDSVSGWLPWHSCGQIWVTL